MEGSLIFKEWKSFLELQTYIHNHLKLINYKTLDLILLGQLVHQRSVSRKCTFFDVCSIEPNENDMGVEVLLKIIDNELTVESLDKIRYGIRLGDIVRIIGSIEILTQTCSDQVGQVKFLMHAKDIQCICAWKEKHSDITFVPRPSIRSTHKMLLENSTLDLDAPTKIVQHCKFWINSNTCHKGESCEMHHEQDPVIYKQERVKWVAERRMLKRERSQLFEDNFDPHGKLTKPQRAAVFVRWLVDKFGVDVLSTGSGVIDIAGGRGEVSFELWNKRSIPCTLIDPRSQKLSKNQVKYLKRELQGCDSVKDLPSHLVKQLRVKFNTTEFLESKENMELVQNASILVGMHPDQATDAIVDVALKFNKPFAIVPCCVFRYLFPNRQIPIGELANTTVSKDDNSNTLKEKDDQDEQRVEKLTRQVVSYDDLVQYLEAKHPSIQTTYLPFVGKNRVLFRHHSE